MTITPFGLIFITLGFTLLVTRPTWLLPLLIVSAVLHAFAVAVIGPATPGVGLGITPWLFTCGLIFIHLVVVIACNRRIEFGVSRRARLLFWGWITFIGWCVLSAFTLPFIFENIPVHPLTGFVGFDGPMEPLVWNISSAIQAANAAIIGMVLVYVFWFNQNANLEKQLISGFIAAILVSTAVSICQKLQLSGFISVLNILHQSVNPSYAPGDSVGRINWPFSEPSYASVWYSGVSLGGGIVYLVTRRIWLGVILFTVGLTGLLLTLGGTGLAGFTLAIFVLIAISAVVSWQKKMSMKSMLWRLMLGTAFAALVCASYTAVREKQPRLPDIYSSVESVVQTRIGGPISYRGQSNLDAITITKNTWGLGSGLGTNRSSSYLLSMMSNIGIPGLLLFFLLVVYQLYLIAINSLTNSTLKAFIFGGTIGMFCGMIMGIPDLLFPTWWIWLIACLATLRNERGERLIQTN